MNRPRMGEMLRNMGMLSDFDVDEILVEQHVAPRRFGEIAVSWGLCQAMDICEAWCRQFASGQSVDLNAVGIDPAAAAAIPESAARRLGVMGIRFMADQLIVAASRQLNSVETAELVRAARRDVRIVFAPAQQVEEAIAGFFDAATAHAA